MLKASTYFTCRSLFTGFYGNTSMEAAEVDVVYETVNDFFQAYYPGVYRLNDEATKVTIKAPF